MSKEKGFCDVCGTEIEVTMCCSSFDCGCMGLPTEPPICSEKCYDTFMSQEYQDDKKTKEILYSLNQKRYKDNQSSFHKKVLEAGTSVYTPYSPWSKIATNGFAIRRLG